MPFALCGESVATDAAVVDERKTTAVGSLLSESNYLDHIFLDTFLFQCKN